MNKFKKYIFSFLVLLFLHSCKKKSSFYKDKILTQIDNKLNELENHEILINHNQITINEPIKNEIESNNIDDEIIDNKGTIFIKTLGIVDEDDLIFATQIINNFFGYDCIISDKLMIPENIYCENNVIDAHKAIIEFNNNYNSKTLYLTENKLKNGSMELRGYTTLYGNTIIVSSKKEFMRETIIHEIGHTLGLEHCEDLTCVMAINNDEYDSGDFCLTCSDKLNNNQK